MKKVYIIRFLTLILLTGIIRPCLFGQCYKGDQKENKPILEGVDSNSSADKDITLEVPVDPNEIIGTKGYDALGDTLQWVAATASLPYTIYFENDPELATAAAQKVEIRHALHSKADISTFAVGAFGFGSHVFTVEGNRSSYQQRLDLTQDMGIYVDVVAGIDIVAGEVFWILQSIDPATGLPPQGTQQGFLPVNDENHSGEGYVSFTIKPKANACVTGDVVTASASIIFDINEAIPTNVWHNTVDALPPTTQLTGTDNGNNEVLLQFSGQDDEGGCGIKQYKLYVSDNYGAYSLYDTYPLGTTATYLTEYDHCYRFFCLGEDNVGNVEAMKEAEVELGSAEATQAVALAQGWNWWSTYVEQDGTNGLEMLETALGHNGLTIKSQNEFVDNYYQYMNEDYWYGSLESIHNEQSYVLNVSEDCNFILNGIRAMPANHPITIYPNWTWIGYPMATPQAVSTALSGFNPSGDDVIKSQTDYAFYYEGYGWFPEDFALVPGNGYKYQSNATENKVLTYVSGNRMETINPMTESLHWTANNHAYADNLNATAVVIIDDVEQRNEHLELGAFVNGVCRGRARLKYFGPKNRYYAMLTVSGQDGERIEFGYINPVTGQCEMNAENNITFIRDAVMGKLDKPFEVHFNSGNHVQSNEVRHLTIYPNPVKKDQPFALDVSKDEVITEITITNMLGAVVRHESGAVNVAAIKGLTTSGVYMIEIVAESGIVYHGRLIVE